MTADRTFPSTPVRACELCQSHDRSALGIDIYISISTHTQING